MRKALAGILLSFSVLLCGCSGRAAGASADSGQEKETVNLFAMNTYITLTAYGSNAESALSAAEDRIRGLEGLLSVTDEDSEIYAVNHSNGEPTAISAETEAAIAFALDMAKKTGGALEPTIYPVLRAWGFTVEHYRIPSQEEIDSLLQIVGYDKVRLENGSVVLQEGMSLDLGAVAKGYAGDWISELFRQQGVTSAILNLGGNVQTVGTKPDGSMWRIGLRAPDADGHIGVLEVSDCAVITSGGYQRYFVGEDQKTYHHIIDPSTGRPAESGIVSATVVGQEGRLCDALSTAFFVMGVDGAVEYWHQNGGFEMILLTDANEIYITEGLEDSFTLQEPYTSCPVVVIRP